jgi:putative tryptophan/tyrosine transport system substrate-binding protein
VQFHQLKRRDFITLLGGAAGWPLAVHAQQPTMPVVGFLNPASADARRDLIAAFYQGLAEIGYVEGRNVAIEYRWAQGQNDRLPVMIADLVQRRVAVIVAVESTAAALAAKAATSTIPIVFLVGADPVELGLVASLGRPGGNMTGVSALAVDTVAKRLQVLHELVPAAAQIAFLRNPTNPYFSALETKELQAAAAVLGVRLLVLDASGPPEIEAAFASLVAQRAGAFLLGTDPLFIGARDQLVALANRHAVPAGSPELDRDFVKAFRSAPPNVTCSIDAAVRLIETELSGWWWNCGYCAARNGASLYVPGSSRIGVAADYKTRPEQLQLLQDPKWGTLLDNGFHCDRGGTVPLAMLAVFLEARIAVELCEQRATSENKVIRLNK